jgi:sucrose phosphorylase
VPRRINRQRLVLADLERELDERGSRRSVVLKGLTGLLRQRQANPAFQPAARAEVMSLDPRIFAIRRVSGAGTREAHCLHNVSGEVVKVQGQVLEPYETRWLG